jgi:hypothetical protein
MRDMLGNMAMESYANLVRTFEEKGCRLLTSPEVVEERRKENKRRQLGHVKVEYIATCGHENAVTITNFVSKSSGLLCKACKVKEVGEKLKEYQSSTDNGMSRSIMQENDVYKQFLPVLETNFTVVKTNEGCLADFIVKPIDVEEDEWLMVQMKTTYQKTHGLYSFALHYNEYKDNVLMCHCISENYTWLIPYNEITAKRMINIGQVSKYNKYKCKTSVVNDNVLKHYRQSMRYPLEVCMKPKNYYQQREQEYKKKRYQLAFLPFCEPEYDNCAHDFILYDHKIQEKVAGTRGDRDNQYIIHLYRYSGKTYRHYIQGMNAFYWIHIPNTDIFYIIPEKELIDRNFIKTETQTPPKKPILSINTNYKSWYEPYKFSYADNEEERILRLLVPKSP